MGPRLSDFSYDPHRRWHVLQIIVIIGCFREGLLGSTPLLDPLAEGSHDADPSEAHKASPARQFVLPVRLAFGNRRLRRLWPSLLDLRGSSPGTEAVISMMILVFSLLLVTVHTVEVQDVLTARRQQLAVAAATVSWRCLHSLKLSTPKTLESFGTRAPQTPGLPDSC